MMRKMILASMLACLPATAVLAQEAAPKGDKVYTGAITTRWGKAVTPENAWRS